ncbi:M23 family metallopeptidase [Paenibacillus macquariensis]|uniref:Peptidase family M23 n=1 Tax=Paenibacillus macquariensis TaxID=948756 RepID=A0ABY1KH78_9BACL|nr:M23 family metallopeptidase [Paenibacillus macquariensis]OAB28401.1 hypothetical protein PMSM_24405 [Paenibacillus macquariensis subsp. macquariensis]SIR71529.1 Peptidase family M23 [Paenibacillus macquariensis]
MNLKSVIKFALATIIGQFLFIFLIVLIVISMVQHVVTLPQKMTNEVTGEIKEFFLGKDPDLRGIDFQRIADEWMEHYEWTNPSNNMMEVGLPTDIINTLRENKLLLPPSILSTITSLKKQKKELWIKDLSYQLMPRDLVFTTISDSNNGTRIVVSQITTYLGKYTIKYIGTSVSEMNFEDDTVIFDKVLKKQRLKQEKELILAISEAYNPGLDLPVPGGNDNIVGEGTEFIRPVIGMYRISSKFGSRIHPVTHKFSFHQGTDYAVPIGTSIYSVADGVVIASKFSSTGGNYVQIKHTNGYLSRYLHMSVRKVKVGDIVRQGQLIGISGNTGRSTGPHLHLEMKTPNGELVNAENYLP